MNNIKDEEIDEYIKKSDIVLLKFDNLESKYNEFFDSLKTNLSSNSKIVNVTDQEIIDFYEIDVIPTIYIYKNKNLMGTIAGFQTKSSIVKRISDIIEN